MMTGIIDGWNRISLDQLIATIQSGSRPKGGVSAESGDIPSLGGENLTLSGGVKLNDVKLVPSEFYNRMSKGHLEKDDVLINKDGAQTGKIGFYEVDLSLACINEHLFLLRGQKGSITQKYLYYFLLSQPGQYQIRSQISGSAQPGLKSNFIRGLIVDVPHSLTEQNKIAHILCTVDRAIEQTEALIAKQQHIKAGLMQDLLTRGIDEQGNLRSEKTHQFKDSLLGRIPVEWEIKILGQLLFKIIQGWSPDCDNDSASIDEWGVLKTTSVTWQGYSEKENKALPKQLRARTSLEIKSGDILMTRAGPNSRVGVVAYVAHTRKKLILSDKIYALTPTNEIDGRFLSYVLSSYKIQNYLSKLKTGLAESQTNISQLIVKSLLVFLPKKVEQEKIADFLDAVSHKLNVNIVTVEKLHALKTALMQDLLTGRKRVTALLHEKEMVNA